MKDADRTAAGGSPNDRALEPHGFETRAEVSSVDLSGEAVPPYRARAEAAPYDPEPGRERLRGLIAAASIGLLIFTIIAAFALAAFSSMPANDLKDFVALVLTPVVALVSAVTGFYYGSSRSRA